MQITDRTKITRTAKRGSYDPETIYEILDQGLFCTIAYVHEGKPFAIPTAYCRLGNQLLIHGSVGSGYMRHLASGIECCIAVTLMNGLVIARSAFHHSVNYQSVVVFGVPQLVASEEEKMKALEQFTEQLIPGRWEDTRYPTKSELQKTMVLSISLDEASAKIRNEGANDDEEDMTLDYWAGVIPLKVVAGEPIRNHDLREEIATPDYLKEWNQRFGKRKAASEAIE